MIATHFSKGTSPMYKYKRAIAGVTALAAVAAGLAVAGAPVRALPAGTAPDGSVTIPATQPLTTTLAMAPNPAPAICDGNGVAGYRWHAFISDSANDPATITYGGGGATAPNGFTSSLITSTGTFATNLNPSSIGQITPIPGFDLSAFGPALAPGEYNIGFACSLSGETTNFWSTGITVSATAYSVGVAPAAPVLSLGVGTGTTQEIIINNPDAGLDAYTLDVNVPLADPLPTVTPGDTSFVLTGLTLGTGYDVELEAVKSGFPNATSNTLSFTAAASFPITVTVLDVFDGDDVIVDWVAPGGPAPASYDVVITDSASAVVATQTGVAGLSATFTGIPQGSGYVATVTGSYAGAGASSTGSDGFSVNPNALIVQEITVTRPPGALILTQRCGVFGPLPAYTADTAFPGYPLDLPAGGPTADQVGTSPDVDLVAPGVQADPEFANYPFPTPPTYPTECGLDLGTASFVTSGPFAGQFYAADGRMNEVTVADTRDGDDGWTVRGDIEDLFTGSTGDTFSGDFLGWVPSVTSDSDPSGTFTYDQLVTAGPAVKSGTTGGLTGNPVLASAPAGSGLGIAELDARMTLLIPLDADAADYTGTLTLTVA
jgi:hypothetical protein